jgi:hypothetical protein
MPVMSYKGKREKKVEEFSGFGLWLCCKLEATIQWEAKAAKPSILFDCRAHPFPCIVFDPEDMAVTALHIFQQLGCELCLCL